MRRLGLGLAVLCCWVSSSYSEEIYGTTNNAASVGLNWVMTNILPEYAGLEVNGLVYSYRTVKDPETDMIVWVQNERADGDGYIFRNADNWSGLPGNTINKSFRFPNLPATLWGPGSIEVDGEGSVEDASVIYSYRYDTCFDPQSDPSCPGYEKPVEIPDIEVYDPLADDLVLQDMENKARTQKEEEEQDRKRRQREWALNNALENLLGDGNNEGLIDPIAEAMALALTSKTFSDGYYTTLDGKEYLETIVLNGGTIQDNKKARRSSLAQQLLHQQMVDSQYESSQQETK